MTLERPTRVLVCALFLAAGCKTTSPTDPDLGASSPPPSIDIPFEKYQLENGLSVILHRDTRLPLVAVSTWYDVGALHEVEGRSGFAHLFEHMMFQGSPHVGEDQFFPILERLGGTSINGTTNFDRTNYIETVPAHELETVLWLESDRMGFLLASLNKKSLEGQIGVVQNERRQSVENREYGVMDEVLTQTLYPKPHPYYGNVIGSMKDIGAATLDDVRDFFRTYYSPANATVTIAGDFEPAAVKALVEKYFGPLKGRPKPQPTKIAAPAIDKAHLVEYVEPIGKLPKISIAWMGPSAFEKDTAVLDLLSHVISGTRSSRLDKAVTYDDQIAQSVTAYFQEHSSGGVFQIDLVVRPGRKIDEALEAIDGVLADLRKNPPTPSELKRAQNTQATSLVRGLEQLGGFGGRAERLQLYNHYLGDPGKVAWDLARYEAVTIPDLSRALETYLGSNRVVLRATPKGGEK